MKLKAPLNSYVPSARRVLVLVAVVVAGLVLRDAIRSAEKAGR